MIIDSIENARLYTHLHAKMQMVFDFLRTHDLSAIPDGRIELDGDSVFINIETNPGKISAQLEAHRCYIDVQFPISQTEKMGWRPTADCQIIAEPYNAARDIEFFADEPTTTFTVEPGQFAIFLPTDAHAPAMASGTLRKAVAKLKIDFDPVICNN